MEFRRIDTLPRRDWTAADDLDALTHGLTDLLKTPSGSMTLRTVQAASIREGHDHGGLFGALAVGSGKSLITLLGPVVVGAQRPVLLVPAALRDQTLRKVLPEMAEHWKLHPNLRVIGYSELSLAKNAKLLEDLQPDMLVMDECQMLRHLHSGRTRRVSRYMAEHPDTIVWAVSGTVAGHSILDYWHIIQWVLKPDNSPLPRGYPEAQEWARALDERVPYHDRLGPGALAAWGLPVREGYRRRLTETPGVVATSEDRLGVALSVTGIREGLKVPPGLQLMMRQVKELWETPDGDIIMEAVQLHKVLRELAQGFYYVFDPKPPEDWLDARKAWHKHVRHRLATNRSGLDTPKQVWDEEAAKTKGVLPEFLAWCAVEDTYKLSTKTVWVDDYLVREAATWLREDGICWTAHQAMGEAVAKVAKVLFFGAGDGRILDAKGPVVASIKAHGTGKNLQQWDRNLVVCPPTSGSLWEQMLGRTHRLGQQSDRVTFEVMQHTAEFRKAMEQAFADARFLEATLGNRQRLLYCDTNMDRSR